MRRTRRVVNSNDPNIGNLGFEDRCAERVFDANHFDANHFDGPKLLDGFNAGPLRTSHFWTPGHDTCDFISTATNGQNYQHSLIPDHEGRGDSAKFGVKELSTTFSIPNDPPTPYGQFGDRFLSTPTIVSSGLENGTIHFGFNDVQRPQVEYMLGSQTEQDTTPDGYYTNINSVFDNPVSTFSNGSSSFDSFPPPNSLESGWAGLSTSEPIFSFGCKNSDFEDGGMRSMNDIMSADFMNDTYFDPRPGNPHQKHFSLFGFDQSSSQQDYEVFDFDQVDPNNGLSSQQEISTQQNTLAPNVVQQQSFNNATAPVQTPNVLNAVGLSALRKVCTHHGCTRYFARDWERTRHERSKHGIGQTLRYCHVVGCVKHHARAGARGFTRADKLTEHMWKKHADLGHVKRVA